MEKMVRVLYSYPAAESGYIDVDATPEQIRELLQRFPRCPSQLRQYPIPEECWEEEHLIFEDIIVHVSLEDFYRICEEEGVQIIDEWITD